MKMDIDRHGPRSMPNNCKNFNRPNFSLPTTFNEIFYLPKLWSHSLNIFLIQLIKRPENVPIVSLFLNVEAKLGKELYRTPLPNFILLAL